MHCCCHTSLEQPEGKYLMDYVINKWREYIFYCFYMIVKKKSM